ncbi:NAD-dependent epimerase/dehydratase family protein [Candidatus Micrarchaeota archaeon]|nr:NAD-dependent epimerase/dehydratase family protein [Candidatus Micrarchaeota archaeon]
MKIMVTGSRGFIGKELVKELTKKNYFVKEFDLELGQDLLNEEEVRKAVNGIDVVIHLAALVDETAGKENLFRVNVKGTENLLEESAKAGVRRFIFLSTVGVMGDIKEKVNEEAAFNPKTDYEKSKAEAERKVNEFQEMIPVTILRSALVIGPNKYWKEIINLVEKGFPLIGNGKNKFQLVYYKDLVGAILFLLKRSQTENETFIVAEEEGKSLGEVYELIQKELGIKKEIKSISPLKAKIMSKLVKGKTPLLNSAYIDRLVRIRDYNTNKFNSLGWNAFVPTTAAIRETIRELGLKK